MTLCFEIIRTLLPLLIVSGIALFVIIKMKRKYKQRALGKKKTKNAQILLDSLIPFGMIIGCLIGIIVNAFFSFLSYPHSV